MSMRRFKVLASNHVDIREVDDEGNPKVYKKGKVVQSETDLCKKFPNKFEELPSNANPTPRESDALTEDRREEAEAEAKAENGKKNKKKKVVAPVEEELTEDEETEAEVETEEAEAETEAEPEEAAAEKVVSKLGKDVTDEFPDAPGFKVFVKGDHYFVAKNDAPAKAVRGPLTKKAVATELRKLHKE